LLIFLPVADVIMTWLRYCVRCIITHPFQLWR